MVRVCVMQKRISAQKIAALLGQWWRTSCQFFSTLKPRESSFKTGASIWATTICNDSLWLQDQTQKLKTWKEQKTGHFSCLKSHHGRMEHISMHLLHSWFPLCISRLLNWLVLQSVSMDLFASSFQDTHKKLQESFTTDIGNKQTQLPWGEKTNKQTTKHCLNTYKKLWRGLVRIGCFWKPKCCLYCSFVSLFLAEVSFILYASML